MKLIKKVALLIIEGFLIKMPKDEKKEEKNYFTNEKAGFYKNYAINWLRKNPEHPKYYLVAEFDSLKKENNE